MWNPKQTASSMVRLALGVHPSCSQLDSGEMSNFSSGLSASLLAAVSKLFSMGPL